MLRMKWFLWCEITFLNWQNHYLDFFHFLVSIEIIVFKGKTNVIVIKENSKRYIKSGFQPICSLIQIFYKLKGTCGVSSLQTPVSIPRLSFILLSFLTCKPHECKCSSCVQSQIIYLIVKPWLAFICSACWSQISCVFYLFKVVRTALILHKSI